MRTHLRTNSCEKTEREDFSQGITADQEKELKSRRTNRTTAQEDHWKVVFRIIFPEHEGDIPSSTCKLLQSLSNFQTNFCR